MYQPIPLLSCHQPRQSRFEECILLTCVATALAIFGSKILVSIKCEEFLAGLNRSDYLKAQILAGPGELDIVVAIVLRLHVSEISRADLLLTLTNLPGPMKIWKQFFVPFHNTLNCGRRACQYGLTNAFSQGAHIGFQLTCLHPHFVILLVC